jgi:hypothetical protein
MLEASDVRGTTGHHNETIGNVTSPRLRLLAAVLLMSGCAVSAGIQVPPDLPNTTVEQFLTLRWTLVREDGRVRAVGTAQSSMGGIEWDATLELLSFDAQGLVVNQNSAFVRAGFGAGPTAFEVPLATRGGEATFRLHVVSARQYERPFR